MYFVTDYFDMLLLFTYYCNAIEMFRSSTNVSGVFLPVVFIGKGVEVFFFLMYNVLQAFIDWCTAVAYLGQHCLKDYDITNNLVFQHIDLHDTEMINIRVKRIRSERIRCENKRRSYNGIESRNHYDLNLVVDSGSLIGNIFKANPIF